MGRGIFAVLALVVAVALSVGGCGGGSSSSSATTTTSAAGGGAETGSSGPQKEAGGASGQSAKGTFLEHADAGREAFIEQGNRICATAETEKNNALKAAFAKAPKQASHPTKEYEEDLVTEAALPPIVRMTEKLARLKLPRAGKAEAQAIVRAFEDAVSEIEADPASVIPGGSEPFAKADRLAAAYGLEFCKF